MITARAARTEDVPVLQADLAKDKRWEQVDLQKGIVCVIEKDGKPIMYGNARLVWQIEPIKFMHGVRKELNHHEQAKATYMCISWLRNWLVNVDNNRYVRSYFCRITNKRMQKLAKSFGMILAYATGKFFGEDF